MFDYTVTSHHNLDHVMTQLKQALSEASFGVLWEFDLAKKFEEKELSFAENYHILEVCQPKEAHRVVSHDLRAGYFLPCKIVVYTEDGQTKIGMPKPTALMDLADETALKTVAEEVEHTLRHVIDQAAQ
ncbi:DUF302 domain-containing protein [Exiguobacterium acetylicum]|uniref:DUF302 domain-containing protein n=1 Tax=Exiguobacterium acetylicum TaxID=41170 RepID=UPI001EE23F6F|nr:DUF302 domain-containing protein [Exiguobacterium acetylicum]UKS56445.1 DUF302 domain-containing protein [Exiguobacterium acetylicum]